MRNLYPLLRRLRRLGVLPTPPPPPSRTHFPVKSLKQLGFFVERKRQHFYVLYAAGGRVPLTLWPEPGCFVVRREGGCGRSRVSRRFETSFLARAIAERRLYVEWNLAECWLHGGG